MCLANWNEVFWGEGVGLPSGGVGKWVVSGNERITEVQVLMDVCLFVCLVHSVSES